MRRASRELWLTLGISNAGHPARIPAWLLGHEASPLGCADGELLARPRESDFQRGPARKAECREAGA